MGSVADQIINSPRWKDMNKFSLCSRSFACKRWNSQVLHPEPLKYVWLPLLLRENRAEKCGLTFRVWSLPAAVWMIWLSIFHTFFPCTFSVLSTDSKQTLKWRPYHGMSHALLCLHLLIHIATCLIVNFHIRLKLRLCSNIDNSWLDQISIFSILWQISNSFITWSQSHFL